VAKMVKQRRMGEENIKNTAISPTNKCRIRITVNLD
jgi:hypothetical protein